MKINRLFQKYFYGTEVIWIKNDFISDILKLIFKDQNSIIYHTIGN